MSTPNIVPPANPSRGFRTWDIDEIFTAVSGPTNRHVPNKGDLVKSKTGGWLEVTQVDYTTGISVLKPWSSLPKTGCGVPENILLGAGPGPITESYRLLIDTSVKPYTLAFDTRLRVYGTTVKYVKVFRGTVVENGQVISRQYDPEGNLLGDQIPLELAGSMTLGEIPSAIKVPQVGYSSVALNNGEPCTAVFYDDVGHVVSYSVLLVRNTSFIRKMNSSMKYITSIELSSPFLSKADDRVLECPINIPINALTKYGVVNYSNGERVVLPIDDSKFSLYGLQRFVSTILGQRQPITLTYRLSADEAAYGSIPGDTMHVTSDYLATTVKVDNAYSVKLFAYPVWVSDVLGYRMTYWLYNLDRQVSFNVTQWVTLSENSNTFDGTLYGNEQELIVELDLSEVSPLYKAYRHVQVIRFTLHATATSTVDTRWTIKTQPDDPTYGINLNAEASYVNIQGTPPNVIYNVDISCGRGSLEHWLRDVYYNSLPLFDGTSEARPPEPTHFILRVGNYRTLYPVNAWDQTVVVEVLNSIGIDNGDIVTLEFIRRVGSNDLQLGVSALPIRIAPPEVINPL